MRGIKKSILLVAVLFVGLLMFTGCDKKKEEETKKSDLKNPKTITVEGKKGKVEVTYDDDGNYEYAAGEEVTLKNTKSNFNFTFSFGTNTIARQEKLKERNAKADGYEVLDVKYNGYSGYVVINETLSITQVVLYVDKANEVVFIAKAKPVNTTKAKNAIKNGTDPKDVIYNLKNVQQILSSIEYIK